MRDKRAEVRLVGTIRGEELHLEPGHRLPHLPGRVGQGLHHLGGFVNRFFGLWTLLQ